MLEKRRGRLNYTSEPVVVKLADGFELLLAEPVRHSALIEIDCESTRD